MNENNPEISNDNPEKAARQEWLKALIKADLEADGIAFKAVIDSCPDDLKKQHMFAADALLHFALKKEQQAVEVINDICCYEKEASNESSSKIDMLSYALFALASFRCIDEDNYTHAFNMLKDVCCKGIEEKVFLGAQNLADEPNNIKKAIDILTDVYVDNKAIAANFQEVKNDHFYLYAKVAKSVITGYLNSNDFQENEISSVLYNKSISKDIKTVVEFTKNYPEDLKLEIFVNKLLKFAKENTQEGLDFIKDVARESKEFKLEMYVNALKDCALGHNQEAANRISDLCPEDLKPKMFVHALSFCAQEEEGDEKAVEIIYDAFSHLSHLKTDILSYLLFRFVLKNDQQAMKMINNICFSNLEKDSFNSDLAIEVIADVLLQYALLCNPEKFNIVKDFCPEDLREKVLSRALHGAIDLKNVERALDRVANALSKDLGLLEALNSISTNSLTCANIAIGMISKASKDPIELFSSELYFQSYSKNKGAVDILTGTCPEDSKEEVFLSALKSYCFFNKEEEIGILIHACHDDLKKRIFLNALKYYALYNIGEIYNKSFETLVNACPDDIKPYMFTQALKDAGIQQNTKAYDMVKSAYQLYLIKGKFLKAIEAKGQETIDKVVENCPENLKQQMFIQVLRDSALKKVQVEANDSASVNEQVEVDIGAFEKKQEVIDMIVKNFPDFNLELRKNVFKVVMSDLAIKMDNEASNMIVRAYEKYSIRNKFLEVLQEKDQQAVDKLLIGCWPNLKKVMFPQALKQFALEKNQKVVDMIIKTCTDELKEHMFNQALKDPALKKDQEAVDIITRTDAYLQFRMSKMAVNPIENKKPDNSKRRKKKKPAHSKSTATIKV